MAKVKTKLNAKLKKFMALAKAKGLSDDVYVTPSLKMDYTPTGSTVLDMLIGGSKLSDGSMVCPGWPKGHMVEIYGRESSGKSTIALTAMGQEIKRGGVGLYVDLEHAVVDTYAMKLGVDFRPPSMGGTGQAMRIAPRTFEETESAVMNAAMAKIDMIVIDSVAGLVSKKEASRDSMDEKDKVGMAEIPRLMSTWLPKLQAVIKRSGTVVLFLNQTRDNLRASSFAKAEETLKTTPGGNALKFWTVIRMMLKPRMSAKAKIYNPILKKNEDIQISTDIEVKMIKNKIAPKQGHSGLITIRYGVGIDEVRTMLNVAEAYGIVKKTKNKQRRDVFSYTSPSTGKKVEYVGIERFRHKMVELGHMEEMFSMCKEKIMEGFKNIDDDELSKLAEKAVITKVSADVEDTITSNTEDIIMAVVDGKIIDENGNEVEGYTVDDNGEIIKLDDSLDDDILNSLTDIDADIDSDL